MTFYNTRPNKSRLAYPNTTNCHAFLTSLPTLSLADLTFLFPGKDKPAEIDQRIAATLRDRRKRFELG